MSEEREFTYPPIFPEGSSVAEVYRMVAKGLGSSFIVEWKVSGGNIILHVKLDNPTTRQPNNPTPEVSLG